MESSISPGTLYKALPEIAGKLAPLFNIPPHIVNGIFSLINGDYELALDMIKTVCEFDPQMIETLESLMDKVGGLLQENKRINDEKKQF